MQVYTAENIYSVSLLQKKRPLLRSFLLGSAPFGRSTPRGFYMLGGSEFRLCQGFACGKTLVAREYARRSEGRCLYCFAPPTKDALLRIFIFAVFVRLYIYSKLQWAKQRKRAFFDAGFSPLLTFTRKIICSIIPIVVN